MRKTVTRVLTGFISFLCLATCSYEYYESSATATDDSCGAQIWPFAVLESCHKPEDGNDWNLALRRLQRSPECLAGCELILANRAYNSPTGFEFCTPMRVHGGPASALTAPRGSNGVIVRRKSTCSYATDTVGGDGLTIRDILITTRGSAYPAIEGKLSHGIKADARFVAENTTISYFSGDGINIEDPDNADTSLIFHNLILRNDRNGIYVKGNNANWALMLQNDIKQNCYKTSGICAGILASSFLGTVQIANVTHSQYTGGITKDQIAVDGTKTCQYLTSLGKPATTCNQPPFITTNDTARDLLIAPYAEGDQLPAKLLSNTVVIGGLTALDGVKTPLNLQAGVPVQFASSNGADIQLGGNNEGDRSAKIGIGLLPPKCAKDYDLNDIFIYRDATLNGTCKIAAATGYGPSMTLQDGVVCAKTLIWSCIAQYMGTSAPTTK